jgi:hypothetical protein
MLLHNPTLTGQGRRSRKVKLLWVKTNIWELLSEKQDTGFALETFPDHPAKRDTGQGVPGAINDRSTTNVYIWLVSIIALAEK